MAYTISEEERQRRSERMKELRAHRAANPPAKTPVLNGPPSTEYRRFGVADFEDMGMWLFRRLVVNYPHLTDRMFSGWLRSLLNANDMLFVRTANAIALAQQSRWPLDPVPYVEEVFVLVRDDALDEGVVLYKAIHQWAQQMGALEIIVERFTDLPRELIAKGTGPLEVHDLAVVRV